MSRPYPKYLLTEQPPENGRPGRWAVAKREAPGAPWIERPTLYRTREAAERAIPAGRRLTAEVSYQPRFADPAEAFARTVQAFAGLVMARGLDDTVDERDVVARGGCPKILAARRDDVIAAAQRQCGALRAA